MPLEIKRQDVIIPQYSLTGDLLSFLRCGLQYRYHSGSSLPPSRPVQLWFGEFIHAILEHAYRIWRSNAPSFPWPCNLTPYHGTPMPGRLAHDIGTIGDTVESTLRAQGKNPRSAVVRESAYVRATLAVNELGPHLFPLIETVEEKVIGTRDVPPRPTGVQVARRANRYELLGIIDVLTDVQLSSAVDSNLIRSAIQSACPGLQGQYEVIVDYKGSRRPPVGHPYWDQGNWQVQTYAWLRTRQPNSLPVAAGVLIYINELAPVETDLIELKKEIRRGIADVIPEGGSQDAYMLSTWRPGDAIPTFSFGYRMKRAIRVIPVDPTTQAHATSQFDNVVLRIEQCVDAEATAGNIIAQWSAYGDDESCAACDFRFFCPDPAPRTGTHSVEAPLAP